MLLPVSLNGIKKPLLYGFSLILLLLLACPGLAAVYQFPDVTQDKGIANYNVYNQYSESSGGIVLPFVGGFGESGNQSGIWGTQSTYYEVYDASEFYSSGNDVIGTVTFKLKLPSGTSVNSSYLMPVSFTTENLTYQYYVKITEIHAFSASYLIEVLDGNQTSLVNTSVAYLGSFSPAYVTFSENKVTVTHTNAFGNILEIWQNEVGSASVSIPYSYCTKLGLDISGYPFPVEVNIKDMDSFETTKSYNSIPMAIYWLISKVIPDNNQSMYYFFKAVDTVWSTSLSIIAICFSMPFMWLFFAGICGLTVCVLRGSLKSGIPAGISTFVSVSMIPVRIMAFILEMLARLITAIKPL